MFKKLKEIKDNMLEKGVTKGETLPSMEGKEEEFDTINEDDEEETKEEVKESTKGFVSEIVGSELDEKLGLIYKVRSNNPTLHFGNCSLEQ